MKNISYLIAKYYLAKSKGKTYKALALEKKINNYYK